MVNVIFFDIDGVLNGVKDYDRFERDTFVCFVQVNINDRLTRHPFGRVNKEKFLKFQELVKAANAKMYMISSWAVACGMDSLIQPYEDLRDFFEFEFTPMSGIYDADSRAYQALEVLKDLESNGVEYRAVYVDDMHDFENLEQLEELKSRCFIVHPKGSIGLTDEEFEKIREYFDIKE